MNCDSLARWYRWLEYAGFGRALERRREEFIPRLHGLQRVLVLGDGDGRFLAALVRANAAVVVDTVDSSGQMLALASKQIGAENATSRVNLHQADARDWQPPVGTIYDAIVTHFFLDCLTTGEVNALVRRVVNFTTPEAIWVVSEFHQPGRGWMAWRARLWIGGLYRFFAWITGLKVKALPEYAQCLERHGFRCEQVVKAQLSLLVSECWQRR